jgi:hypothetical protein
MAPDSDIAANHHLVIHLLVDDFDQFDDVDDHTGCNHYDRWNGHHIDSTPGCNHHKS